jgi:hypothetical protein
MNKIYIALLIVLLIVSGCSLLPMSKGPDVSSRSTSELIAIAEDEDSGEWIYAVYELGRRPDEADIVAPALARALSVPRHDFDSAGQALGKLGPAGKPAIPILLDTLTSSREEVRAFALVNLGLIGEASKCAVPRIAEMLWDSSPIVRPAAAGALDVIAGVDNLDYYDAHNLERLLYSEDDPEGSKVGPSRNWWLEEGMDLDWNQNPENCASTDE